MIRYIHRKKLWENYRSGVRKILFDADKEFYPPLSARNSTTQTVLSGDGNLSDTPVVPEEYFKTMSGQSIVLAIQDETIAGFLSYKPGYELEIDGKKIICSYVSTIVVSPEFRGQGVTGKMYLKLFECSADKYVATRTWSKNTAHIHILDRLGFDLIMTLKDDRGPGIDTVYYGKEISNE